VTVLMRALQLTAAAAAAAAGKRVALCVVVKWGRSVVFVVADAANEQTDKVTLKQDRVACRIHDTIYARAHE
jgi:hypothetical protein